jgi:SAM-dependent methyltransferase
VTLWEGFGFYQLVREMYPPLFEPEVAIDFGCGWGRLTRFFTRHFESENLIGLDTLQEMVDDCTTANEWATFRRVDLAPPTDMASASCDLIYAYSVFSHLSESAHDLWIAEFARLLRPGGLLVVTTRGRDFIVECATIRDKGRADIATSGASSAFYETEQWLGRYDAGEFCYHGVGGGEGLPSETYGEACVPRAYVEAHWPADLNLVAFIDDRSRCAQNVIVASRAA